MNYKLDSTFLAVCTVKGCGFTWALRNEDDSCQECLAQSLKIRCDSQSKIINNYRNYFKEKFGPGYGQSIFYKIEG